MLDLRAGADYSRRDIWAKLKPFEVFPAEGDWLTGYVNHGRYLLIFANLGVPGHIGQDFPSKYDLDEGVMDWFGKTNAHSAQPIFRDLFEGKLSPEVFVRWDTKDTNFLYLGSPKISEYNDFVEVTGGVRTIRVEFKFGCSPTEIFSPPPEGLPSHSVEGGKVAVQVNKYERDPRLRQQCVKFLGATCQVCRFDFESVYGELGKNFCHVHHIRPLSEVDERHDVNPEVDLIPVCPNCHAMLHARIPALTPLELKELITTK